MDLSLQPIKANTKENTSWLSKPWLAAGGICIRGSFIVQIVFIFHGKKYDSYIVNKEHI